MDIKVILMDHCAGIGLGWSEDGDTRHAFRISRDQAVQLVKDLTDVLAAEHIDIMPQDEFVALKAEIRARLDTSTG